MENVRFVMLSTKKCFIGDVIHIQITYVGTESYLELFYAIFVA